MSGKKVSDETKYKQRIAKLGNKLSDKHKRKIGLSLSGEKSSSSILTWSKVNKIRHRYFWIKDKNTFELGKLYNVHQSTISAIIQGRNWNPNKLTKEQLINNSRRA